MTNMTVLYLWLQSLVEEIDGFQGRIDQVKEKAEKLVAQSQGQPDLHSLVDKQLNSLDDSYLSLQATAMQIKVSSSVFIRPLYTVCLTLSGERPFCYKTTVYKTSWETDLILRNHYLVRPLYYILWKPVLRDESCPKVTTLFLNHCRYMVW